MMRSSVDKDGRKHFNPSEYLTRGQILSQFGMLAAKKRRGDVSASTSSVSTVDEQLNSMPKALET